MDASRIGVIFDCDGTLVDSMGVWRELEADLAGRAGVELSQEDVDTLTTLTIPEVGVFFHDRFGLGSSRQDVEDMIDDFMMDFYGGRCCARPGALALVHGLAERGVHMSLASSTPSDCIHAAMEHCGFSPCLDAILSVDDVGASKREPAVYDRARKIMGTPLESTWGAEDSIYALRTLRRAGYRTLGVYDCDLSGTMDQLAENADRVIASFEELDAQTLIAWTC